MQASLDTWVTQGLPSIFYLDWKTHICAWIYKMPKEYTYRKQFKWNKRLCTLVGNFPKEDSLEYKSQYQNVPFLKSHLQKCIRKGNVDLAVKTAHEFLFVGMTDFLRRLPIIVVEDVTVVQEYPIIIWFMLANDKIVYRTSVIKWLLGFVECLTKYPYASCYRKSKESYILSTPNTLLYSLQIRKKWGGMAGDLELIEGAIHKTAGCTNIPSLNITSREIPSKLKLCEWDLTAIDFHCSDIIQKIQQKYTITSQNLSRLIWLYRSCINFRKKRHTTVEDKVLLNNLGNIDIIAKKILMSSY